MTPRSTYSPTLAPAKASAGAARALLLFALAIAIALTGVGCKSLPEIRLTTPEPIQLDPIEVKVRIDLYQHGDGETSAIDTAVQTEEVVERQRNRMAEIQELKNNRIVGENHRGLLEIKNLPGGDYGNYVDKTVEEENWDRTFLMRGEAKRRDTLLPKIQEEQWIRRKELSFEGEWVQVIDPGKEGAFRWEKKG